MGWEEAVSQHYIAKSSKFGDIGRTIMYIMVIAFSLSVSYFLCMTDFNAMCHGASIEKQIDSPIKRIMPDDTTIFT